MEQVLTRKTAIIVDGGYYRVRAQDLWGKKAAQARADELYEYCLMHIKLPAEPRDLYRIFYYDCPPMMRSMIHPLTQKTIEYAKMTGKNWTEYFFNALLEKRKVALRMGELAESTAKYVLKDIVLEKLIAKEMTVDELKESDFWLDVKQKGVDMRIGLDVALLAQNRLVDQVILIAGDSDFLPVVKMARKSGIDVLLDPMKQRTKKNMQEHVDGIESYVE